MLPHLLLHLLQNLLLEQRGGVGSDGLRRGSRRLRLLLLRLLRLQHHHVLKVLLLLLLLLLLLQHWIHGRHPSRRHAAWLGKSPTRKARHPPRCRRKGRHDLCCLSKGKPRPQIGRAHV